MCINVLKKHRRHTQSLTIKQYLTRKCANVSNDPDQECISDKHSGNGNMT